MGAVTAAARRRFRGKALAAALAIALAGPAWAADERAPTCDGAASAAQVNGTLAFLRAALPLGAPRIAVLGTGSAHADNTPKAWPEVFKDSLAPRLPGKTLQLTLSARRSESAERQLADLRSLLTGKPQLVIWQTGTVDAVRHADVIEFSAVLIDGITLARDAGADVVLVGPQYSPRASALVNFSRYISVMAQIARAYDVPFLDRYGLMQEWADSGRVDLNGGKETWPAVAKFVHGCVGMRLAELVGEAAGLDGATR